VSALAFEQAAGFLRVRDGEHALDATAVHPERYPALEALAARHGKAAADLLGEGAALVRDAAELDPGLGPLGRAQVVAALEQAGRDPRPAFVPFAFRDDVRAIEDLKPGMLCPGVVTNVASFGVFVDVGARHDGLVHVSQLARKPAPDGASGFQVGDRVEVRVLKVDLEKKQVSLSMRPRPERPRPAARAKPRAASRSRPERPAGAAKPPQPRPEAPAREAPKPERARPRPDERRAKHERPARPAPGGASSPGKPTERRPEPRRPAFNNPFAVLAGLKKKDG
jgi:uncharacterized protein